MVINSSISGVSRAIKKTLSSYHDNVSLVELKNAQNFTIKIANTIEEREAVFKLAYQVYLEKGYCAKNSSEWLIRNYDFHKETIILIVQDQEKNIIGSASLVFDGSSRLPAEKIYGAEIKKIREVNKKNAELSRLVINPKYRNVKEVLVLLFNYSAIYIHHVMNYDGLLIQVNPRHKNYYKALLNFQEIGDLKLNKDVQNAPSILLYLSVVEYQLAIRQSDKNLNTDRTLYPYFLKPEQEKLVTCYLKKQARQMSENEKIYFGFTTSGISRTVCV